MQTETESTPGIRERLKKGAVDPAGPRPRQGPSTVAPFPQEHVDVKTHL
jgi:hypothetical protein